MSVHIGQTFDQQTDHVPEDFTGAEEAQAKENAEYIGLHGDLIQLPFAISDLQAAFEQGYLPGEYADAANSTTASSGKSALDRDLNGWMDEVFLPGSSGKRKAGDDGLASPLPDKRQKAVLNGVPGRSLARLGQRGGRW